MRGGLFMVVDGLAIMAASLSVEFGHVVNVLLCQAAHIVDGGNFCRQWGEAGVFAAALLVAGLCGLALGVCAGVAFHGWDLWVELTG